jgi:hypothetical protein
MSKFKNREVGFVQLAIWYQRQATILGMNSVRLRRNRTCVRSTHAPTPQEAFQRSASGSSSRCRSSGARTTGRAAVLNPGRTRLGATGLSPAGATNGTGRKGRVGAGFGLQGGPQAQPGYEVEGLPLTFRLRGYPRHDSALLGTVVSLRKSRNRQ